MRRAVSQAIAYEVDVGVCCMRRHPAFEDIGKRMLNAWFEGVAGLHAQRVYALGEWRWGEAFTGFSEPSALLASARSIGRSELL